MVKKNFEIMIIIFVVFTRGIPEKKLNKLESESENEGRGRLFGKFSY